MTPTFPVIEYSFLSISGITLITSIISSATLAIAINRNKIRSSTSNICLLWALFLFLCSSHYIATFDNEVSFKQLAKLESNRKKLPQKHLVHYDAALTKYAQSYKKLTVGEYYKLNEFALAFETKTPLQIHWSQ